MCFLLKTMNQVVFMYFSHNRVPQSATLPSPVTLRKTVISYKIPPKCLWALLIFQGPLVTFNIHIIPF